MKTLKPHLILPLCAVLLLTLFGCTKNKDADDAPVACIRPEITTVTTSQYETYYDCSADTGAYTYFWDFGDGTTSTYSMPGHMYITAGTYTLSLTKTNSAGSNTQTKTMIVTQSTTAPWCAGAYTCTEECSISGSASYDMSIYQAGNSAGIAIYNFPGITTGFPIAAVVNDDHIGWGYIYINTTTKLEGYGIINEAQNRIVFNYTLTDTASNETETCTINCLRK